MPPRPHPFVAEDLQPNAWVILDWAAFRRRIEIIKVEGDAVFFYQDGFTHVRPQTLPLATALKLGRLFPQIPEVDTPSFVRAGTNFMVLKNHAADVDAGVIRQVRGTHLSFIGHHSRFSNSPSNRFFAIMPITRFLEDYRPARSLTRWDRIDWLADL